MSAFSKWYPLNVVAGALWTPASNVSFKGGVLGGFSIRNTGASAVQVDIYDNASAGSGLLLASVDLTAVGTVGASATVLPGGSTSGTRFANGLFAVFTGTGTPKGSLFVG